MTIELATNQNPEDTLKQVKEKANIAKLRVIEYLEDCVKRNVFPTKEEIDALGQRIKAEQENV